MVTNPDMLWLVIASGVACFFMAFVTGANDIANTFSTSIGSKAVTIKKALIIAFFFEALGASLLGGTVTDSIRSKIINFEAFYDAPEFLMLGMFSALMGATIWLAIATCFGLPVSTTHSIIGALMGFGLAAGHNKSIKWEKIHSIVISWFAAPILAGSCSAMAFILLLYQNPIVLNIECKMKKDNKNIVTTYPCYLQDWSAAHPFYSTLICLALSSILTIVGSIVIYIVYNKRLNSYSFKKKLFGDDMMNDLEKNAKENTICNVNNSSLNSVASNDTQATNPKGPASQVQLMEKKKMEAQKDFQAVINVQKIDMKEDLAQNNKNKPNGSTNNNSNNSSNNNNNNNDMSQNIIEKFDLETEIVFSSLQIISAILGVVAQSANDTANAIGPFAAVFNTYNNGVKGKLKVQWYILLFGGLSMSLGLSVLGYRVIKTVGMKLIKITPSRGFTIELISGLVVLFFSICGIPLSSTHCAVSSVIGLGLVEMKISQEDNKNAKGLNNKDNMSQSVNNTNNVILFFASAYLLYSEKQCTVYST
ncbi:phosphate transporter, partial [Plasmodium malariae]